MSRGLDGLALAAIEDGGATEQVLKHIEHNLAIDGAQDIDASHLASLVKMEAAGDLSATQAKQVLAEMVESGSDPASIAKDRGFEAMDTTELEAMLTQVIADNADEWQRFCEGDDKTRGKLQGFFTGQIMRLTKGQADGKVVNQILQQKSNEE